MISENLTEKLKLKRIAGIDFGLKRVGVAVCDELHISISPKAVLAYDKVDFWELLVKLLNSENVSAVVVGVPVRKGNLKSYLFEKIDEFIAKLKELMEVEVYTQDESYTSLKAVDTMVAIGKKKKDRRTKGNTDKIAAAIILQDFLNENFG